MAKDPVCNMEVDPKSAVAKSDYRGKTYYFCAIGCKREFDMHPERYVAPESEEQGFDRVKRQV